MKPSEPRGKAIARAMLFTVLMALLQFLRRPDCLKNGQFWAEDAQVFYSQQVSHGFLWCLSTCFAGYLHTIPRLIAFAASPVPTRWTPHAYNAAALLLDSIALAAFAWPCFRPIVRSDALRVVCCLIAGSAIYPGIELVATVCDVQWYLTLLFLLLLWLPPSAASPSRGREALLAAAQSLIVLSAPATLLGLPILLWQIVRRPGWLRWRPAICAAAALLQAALLLLHPQPRTPVPLPALLITTVKAGTTRCVLSPMLGHRFLEFASAHAFHVLIPLTLFALLVIVLYLLYTGRCLLTLSIVYFGALSVFSSIAGRDLTHFFIGLDGLRLTAGERYWLIGAALVIVLVAMALESAFSRLLPPWRTLVPCLLLLALYARGMRVNVKDRHFPDLHWSTEAPRVDQWKRRRDAGKSPPPLVVPVNPPPFAVRLP